jgi:Family of unknown function (DUF6205)
MGYLTRITGRISIDPPLTYAEIKASGLRTDDLCPGCEKRDTDLMIEICVSRVEDECGIRVLYTGVALLPVSSDRFKAYGVNDEFKAFIERFRNKSFSGHLEGRGEDDGDIWRLVVVAGSPRTLAPKLLWPKAEEGQAL